MAELPKRKKIRLQHYDYGEAGAYFVTLCAENRKRLFGTFPPEDAVGAAISRPLFLDLSAVGRIVKSAIEEIPKRYPNVSVKNYVIMPNHVHLLLQIDLVPDGRLIAAPTLSQVVGQMKRWCSKTVGHTIWQKSFYEHIIRNGDDYCGIWNYIDGNPQNWRADEFYCL